MIKKIGIITIVLFMIIGVKNVSFAASKPEVLILHSYSPDYEWTVSIQEGITSVLKPLESQYNLRVEYMDTNHNPSLIYRQLLYSLYKEKYAKTQFSIILVTDNAALDFIREYRDELFPSTPVVFCGINGYRDSMLSGFPLVTGVAETNDFLGAFTAAFTVYPKAREMIVYGQAEDISHKGNHSNLRDAIFRYQDRGKVSMREFPTIEQIIEDAKSLPPQTIIFMDGNMIDANGKGLSLQQATEMLSAAVDIPVFSSVDVAIGHGAVGGKVLRGFDQGRQAAEIVLRILEDEPVSNIPVIENPRNVYKFDYKQIQRFHLNLKDIPENAILVNSPELTYKVERGVFWGVVITVSALAVMVALLMFNIRSRRKVEKALADSEEKFFKAFRHCADVLAIVSLQNGHYLEVSDVFYRIFGYHRDEVIGHSAIEFNLWENTLDYTEVYKRLCAGEVFRNEEKSWRRKDGSMRIGLWSAEVVEIGGEECIIVAWVDISELKQTQEELRNAHNQLEIKVAMRTQELSSTLNKLRKAQDYLVQSEKMTALGSLVAGVAHEINTPVGVSVTAASYLEKNVSEFRALCETGEIDYSKLTEYLDDFKEASTIILSNLERAARLIKSFKQVSVDQSSEMRRIFNVKQYLEEIVVSINPQMKKTQHKLSIQCDGKLEINGYPGSFSQIITNLVFNSLTHAFDANDKGEMNIEIEKTGDILVLTYSDNGKGMKKSVVAHIFDPFFTTKRGSGGTGLGLYITYNIVTQQFGGEIVCTSELGKGTTFVLSLPLNEEGEGIERKYEK